MLRRILDEGHADGSFDVDDAGLLARAILTMCTSVALWYRPSGQLSPEEIGEQFAAFALKMARREAGDGEPAR
jgi:hypothetical protein